MQLSGGQRQRVALARAIVNRPKVLLLDEPLGALDLKLRQEMQVFLKSLQRELGMTFVYVTHDQEEALTMSDHVAVFNDGEIEQVGTPDEVYERPRDRVRRRLRRHLEHRRARRPAALVRPERIASERIRRAGDGRRRRLRRRVHAILVDTDAGERLTVVRQNDGSTIEPGTRVHVAWRAEDAYEIDNPPPPTSSRRSDDEAHVGAAARSRSSRSRSPRPA